MQSIGERLEEARKRKGISIREAAEATKIRSEYLHKFESNQFDIKLPEIYVRGFLRTYANYLKSPADKIISDYHALGLSEPKSGRGLNRDVYGRMDLSVASAKAEKDANETPPPADGNASHDPSGTRNPATFVPKAAVGMPMDRTLFVKGAALAAAAVIVVFALIYIFGIRGEKNTTPPNANHSAVIWRRPQPGDPIASIRAEDRVQVTVKDENGETLLQEVLARGDRRDIVRRGKLSVSSDTPENIRVNIGGPEWWPLQDTNTGAYLKTSVINPPAPRR